MNRPEQVVAFSLLRENRNLDIPEHREPVKDIGDLEGPCHASSAYLVSWELTDIFALESDSAPVRSKDACDQIEQGRLAGPVGPDNRYKLPFLHGQFHPIDGQELVKGFGDPFNTQHGLP
jgi:hypothetical protein